MQDSEPFDWNLVYVGDETDYSEPDFGFLDVIDGLRPGRALDIGCGAGGLVMDLCQRGWQVTGIDIAANAIKAARKIVQAQALEATLHIADATRWQPDGHYDLVTNSFALPGDKEERVSVFHMIKNALAPGGTVLLKDFDSTMHRVSFFAGLDLVTVNEFTTAFDTFNILAAQLVDTPLYDYDSGGRVQDEPWTAAFLHAQRPCLPDN